VGASESLVANFVDIQPPTIRITAPVANEKVSTAAFTLKRHSSDNAAVVAVYYNLNGTGWQPASSTTGFKTWFAKRDSRDRWHQYHVRLRGRFHWE